MDHMFQKKSLYAALALLMSASVSQAATFNVTTTVDEVDANIGDGVCATAVGDCTLRAAVQEANAWSGADTIELPDGLYVLALVNPDSASTADDQAAAWGDLDITEALTIHGTGADLVAIDAMAKTRLFEILPDSPLMEVNISGVTLRNGNGGSSNGNGGAIESEQNTTSVIRLNDCNVEGNTAASGAGISIGYGHYLHVDHCVLSGNTALAQGSAIYSLNGNVVIDHSEIRDNTYSGFSNPFGAGIYNTSFSGWSTPTVPGFTRFGLTITNSTLSGNSSFLDGGALYHVVGPLYIENSTFSGNTAQKWGGAIYLAAGNFGPTHNVFKHVTITDNVSVGLTSYNTGGTAPPADPRGGGLYTRGKLDIYNSILAYNGSGGNCYLDTSNGTAVPMLSKQGDIITDNSCESTQTSFPDPALDVLANNGGATQTHALFSYSAAKDVAGAYSCLSKDQRGYGRDDGNCDAGSYEFGGTAPVSELVPVPAYAGPAAVRSNTAPVAFGMPLAVNFGGSVSSVASAADSDGDPLTYEVVQQPVYGSIGWDGLPPGRFTYTADPELGGALKTDSFMFRACDGIACSDPATITIFIGDAAVTTDIAISLTTTGTVTDLTVISQATVEALVADVNYTQPLGSFFFGVSGIPTDSGVNTATVVIQLPATATIDANAVVRKLDNNDTWQTLAATGDGTVTTAVIDAANKTITMVLVDNDIFDRDPTVGVIYDPMALSVPVNPPAVEEPVVTPPVEEVPVDTPPVESMPTVEVPVAVTPPATVELPVEQAPPLVAEEPLDDESVANVDVPASTNEELASSDTGIPGGGGSVNWGLLPLLALLGWRRRGC